MKSNYGETDLKYLSQELIAFGEVRELSFQITHSIVCLPFFFPNKIFHFN